MTHLDKVSSPNTNNDNVTSSHLEKYFKKQGIDVQHLWPGFDFPTCHHMWKEFVVYLLYSERFSPGTPVFPSHQKPTFI